MHKLTTLLAEWQRASHTVATAAASLDPVAYEDACVAVAALLGEMRTELHWAREMRPLIDCVTRCKSEDARDNG